MLPRLYSPTPLTGLELQGAKSLSTVACLNICFSAESHPHLSTRTRDNKLMLLKA